MKSKAVTLQPTAVLLTIGDELLSGRTLNTNAAFLGRQLTDLGISVVAQHSCRDDIAQIQQVVKRFEFADVLVLTGGLGPTPDDVTRQAIAKYFNSKLCFSPSQYKAVRAIYRKLGRKLPRLSRQELYYPEAAKPLINRFGIALGFWISNGKQAIIVLPGVPTELRKMVLHDVLPFLRKRFRGIRPDHLLAVRLVGISEPAVMETLKKDFFNDPFRFGIYPSEGEVQICIRSPNVKIIRRLKQKIVTRLNPWIYSWGDRTLAETVGEILVQKKKTVAVAESCTGGSLAFAWTRHAGASRFFRGGAVVYHALAKQRLGVAAARIKQFGEVSAEVAEDLAVNARRFWDADYGVGITGIAGPSGGTKKKPVGLVCIALADSQRTLSEKLIFWGNRDQVQRKSVMKALELLWRFVRKK